MFGKGEAFCEHARRKHGTGGCPTWNRIVPQEAWRPSGNITVAHFHERVVGGLPFTWVPYCMFRANCQHYVSELQAVLRNPVKIKEEKRNPDIMAKAVREKPSNFEFASDDLRRDPNFVFSILVDLVECSDSIGKACEVVRHADQDLVLLIQVVLQWHYNRMPRWLAGTSNAIALVLESKMWKKLMSIKTLTEMQWQMHH